MPISIYTDVYLESALKIRSLYNLCYPELYSIAYAYYMDFVLVSFMTTQIKRKTNPNTSATITL